MSAGSPSELAAQPPARPVPVARPVESVRHNLPLPLTSFIGREREVAAVSALLRRDGVRLVTLIGPGGVGKTRLALRVADEVADAFPDGVWFVPLATIQDPNLVTTAVAEVLGVRESSGRPFVASLQAFLRDMRALLILDNFEHLLEAAPVVTDLLMTCPLLTVLATSRAVLRVSGEHDFLVPPLSLPPDSGAGHRAAARTHDPRPAAHDSEAVRLFVERARSARADFALTADNAANVAQICHRLDGLPLAIELAAAQNRLLAPAALLARLENRLPLLTGGPRDQPARLQTMRDAIAWSYELLAPDEQLLFRRLAVFSGGFTLEAAAAVVGHDSVLRGVTSLVENSLLRPRERPGSADRNEPRFTMLETLREFGLEQVAVSGEEEAVRDDHVAYFLALAERAEPHLHGPRQVELLDRLEAELPNFRAALDWLRKQGRVEEGLRLAGAPGPFWWRRGSVSEGRAWLEAFLTQPAAGGATPGRVRALNAAGELAAWQNDTEQAIAWHSEATELARALGDTRALAMSLLHLGYATIYQNEPARAESLLAESVARFLDQGDSLHAARARHVEGEAALAQGDVARAAACFEAALAVFRDEQDASHVGGALEGVGYVALARGDEQGARRAFAESFALACELGHRTGITWSLMDLAGVAALAGQGEQAARLLGASAALRTALGVRFAPHEKVIHDRIDTAARAALDASAFAAAWEHGAALSFDDAVAEATAVAEGRTEGGEAFAVLPFDSLTRREIEVLRLLVDGRSDKEIAAALAIARPTVSNHVAAILAKLGLPSRAAAAAYAVRHRLV